MATVTLLNHSPNPELYIAVCFRQNQKQYNNYNCGEYVD